MKVKSEAESRTNFEAAAALVPARYEAGVRAASWKDAALEGQALYEEMMQRADILARRAAGIRESDDATWRQNAIDKGRPIIGARMKASAGKQVEGFRPYRNYLEGLTLEPRTGDPATNVMNRVIPIAVGFADLKKSIKG